MTRPDYCPNCGSGDVRNHTGTYCQDCGEPLMKTPQQSTMTVSYTVSSMEDLAKMLEDRADTIEAMAPGSKTQREARRFQAQAGGMRMAARMVRSTKIEGA